MSIKSRKISNGVKRIVLVAALAGLTLVASREGRAADIEAVLDDAAGASAFSVKDSGSVEGAHIDSDGNMVIKGGLRLDASGVENTTAENLIVDGNVGIGTTAPGAKLDVAGVNAVVNTVSHNQILRVTDAIAADIGPQLGFWTKYTAAGNYQGIAAIAGRRENATDGNLQGYLQFITSNNSGTLSEKMRITSDGNVGIGTTGPQTKLVVSNGGTQNIEIDPDFIQSFNRITPGYAPMPFYASVYSFNGGGNVGIGTTGPGSELHISSTKTTEGAGALLRVFAPSMADNNGVGIWLGKSAATDASGTIGFTPTATAANSYLTLGLYGTAGPLIVGKSNVGIGTTGPNAVALLDVSSTTKGFLPPRMTTIQRDAVTTPPAGLMIYNTTTNKLNFYNGTAWEAVTSA